MDQRIGIEYVVTGHDTVMEANKQLAKGLVDVRDNIRGLSTGLIDFTDKTNQYSTKLFQSSQIFNQIKNLQDATANLKKMTGDSRVMERAGNRTGVFVDKLAAIHDPAQKAATAVNNLAGAVNSYVTALQGVQGLRIPRGLTGAIAGTGGTGGGGTVIPVPGGGGPTRGGNNPTHGGRSQSLADDLLGMAPMFMIRYKIFSELLQGGKYAINDVMLGRSRQELAAGLGDLSAVSFTSSQKKQTEMAGQMFSQRFWTTTTEQYVQAMSQTASAFSIGELGFEQLRKMNDSVLAFGMISKMKPEAASELMSQNLRAFLAFQDPTVSETLEKGGVATVKGLGKRKDGKEIEPFTSDMGGIMERMAAQAAKAIEISSIWGSGIANTFRHSLPVMLNMGWNPAAALALAGTAKDMGFHAGQGGRGFKDMFTSFPTSMAKVALMGLGKWQDETKIRASGDSEGAHQAHLQNQMMLKQLTPFMAQQMSTPEDMMKIMPIIGQLTKQAQAKGWRLIEDMGISKNFIPLFQAFEQQGAMDRFKSLFEKISGDNIDKEMYEKAAATLDDAGTAWQRVSGAMGNFFESLADTPLAHQVASAFDVFNQSAAEMRLSKAMNSMNKEGRTQEDKIEFIENMMPGWKNKFGENIAEKMRAQGYMDAGIKMMKDKDGSMVKPFDYHSDLNYSSADVESLPWPVKTLVRPWYRLMKSNAKSAMTDGFNPQHIENAELDLLGDSTIDSYSSTQALAPTAGNIKLPMDKGLAKSFAPAPERSIAGQIFDWLWGPAVLGDEDKAKLAVGNGSYVPPSTPQTQQEKIQPVAEEANNNFSFKLFVGQREIRDIFVEMIEENRVAGYQSFGSDPMGFNTGVG